jgi:pyruvate formate lyase activating enzyme
MKEVYLYKKLAGRKTQCRTCPHFCLILPGNKGICRVRENINGKLYALNYAKAVALNIDPIEKKPFFHFLPGSQTLSFAAVGCNFSCLNCQNWDISQGIKKNSLIGKEIPGKVLLPKQIVKMALEKNLPSISYTYSEPTIFLEYALDTMILAKKAGLKNVFVSNGFMSPESAKLIIPYLDAINIDIKSFSEDFYNKVCQAKLKPVLNTAKLMKKANVWLEITTLAIPTLSDSEENFKNIAQFIKKELGPETPWHISRFCSYLSWQLKNLPDTPLKTIKIAYSIGKKTGLKYVYVGNI